MNTEQCPACGQRVALVRGIVLESHYRADGKLQGNFRSGAYCEGSGYTVDQARRWSKLTDDQKRSALATSPATEAR